ncbi:hypothetical protein ACWGK1_24730, partial [Streptomyces wedmorensis]
APDVQAVQHHRERRPEASSLLDNAPDSEDSRVNPEGFTLPHPTTKSVRNVLNKVDTSHCESDQAQNTPEKSNYTWGEPWIRWATRRKHCYYIVYASP